MALPPDASSAPRSGPIPNRGDHSSSQRYFLPDAPSPDFLELLRAEHGHLPTLRQRMLGLRESSGSSPVHPLHRIRCLRQRAPGRPEEDRRSTDTVPLGLCRRGRGGAAGMAHRAPRDQVGGLPGGGGAAADRSAAPVRAGGGPGCGGGGFVPAGDRVRGAARALCSGLGHRPRPQRGSAHLVDGAVDGARRAAAAAVDADALPAVGGR